MASCHWRLPSESTIKRLCIYKGTALKSELCSESNITFGLQSLEKFWVRQSIAKKTVSQ